MVFGYILFIWKDGKVAALEQKENNNVLNLNKTKFKIRLGGLFALFSRSLDEGCDKSSPLLHNIEVCNTALIINAFSVKTIFSFNEVHKRRNV